MKQACFKRNVSFIATAVFTVCLSVLYFRFPQNHQINAAISPTLYSDETIVIDAGHGGEDGGAISFSGAIESQINLAIALKLDQIFGLYGVNTVLLRSSDISLHDADAKTIREKKISDLHNRVDTIQAMSNPIVISIHQNTYTSSQYHGAQVFYANGELSLPLAQIVQDNLRQSLDPDNNRQVKEVADTVYLMNHISCRAILVECGFLSNQREDQLLQTPEYQTKLAAALAGSYLEYQQITQEGESVNAS